MAKVKVKDVVDGLEMGHAEMTTYLNRKTGEVFTVTADDEQLLDEEELADLPDWQKAVLPKIREVVEGEGWLALPGKVDIHEWKVMERFALSQSAGHLQDELLDAMRGRGAFRAFKNIVRRRGIEEAWYGFRNDALAEIAREWLEANQIEYE